MWGAVAGGCGRAEVVATEWVRCIGNGESKPGPGEDVHEGLLEVCRQFLDKGVPDDGVDGCVTEHVDGKGEEGLGGERCACAAALVFGSGGWRGPGPHALGERRRGE